MAGPLITVVGETVLDYVPTRGGGFAGRVGGSPANVARGLARLGRSVLLQTAIGDDEAGQLLTTCLGDDGVRVDPASLRPGHSSTARAHLDGAGRASYELDIHWDPGALPVPAGTTWWHTGSLATVMAPGAAQVETALRACRTTEVPTSIDFNVRDPLPWPADRTLRHLLGLARDACVVKASEDDVALLAPGQDPRVVARGWLGHGRTVLVVVTLGERGAWAATELDEIEVGTPAVQLVDTVGAGDSFMAALIEALLPPTGQDPKTWRQVLDDPRALAHGVHRANVAAAICCEREGADPPTRATLGARLRA